MALALRREEGLGLGIAIAAHAALVAVLLLRPQAAPVVQPPERIEVTISEDVSLTSTAPQLTSAAAPSIAPALGEPQPDSAPAEAAPPEPAEPAPAPPAPPQPRPAPAKAEPAPTPQAQPRPRPTRSPPPPKPAPKTPVKEAAPKAPAPKAPPQKAPPQKTPVQKAPAQKAPAQKAPAQKAPAAKAPAQKAPAQKGSSQAPAAKAPAKSNAPAGGSRIGSDFLEGVTGASSNTRTSTSAAAATIGPEVRSSLASAISRQLKPRWQAPQGPDAENLVTILSFNLNRDGSLAGTPSVVRQLGINDVNRNQAARHAEQAIRAVRLAAPFDLPDEYYDAWKRVSQFRFDKRLSQ